jgi:hypothetical protein
MIPYSLMMATLIEPKHVAVMCTNKYVLYLTDCLHFYINRLTLTQTNAVGYTIHIEHTYSADKTLTFLLKVNIVTTLSGGSNISHFYVIQI